MDGDDTPLLESGSAKKADSPKDGLDLKNMVLFHGKELAGKSFIRSPHYNLVRIGISKDGIYKLDSATSKVLTHWRFRDIRDSSYSGFSFTLQFRGGRSDYNVRTDDGEAICNYIESFQKNPEKALEQALSNPPVSKVPEHGLMTLRRKFSGDPKPPIPEVKFYTLNRKSTKKSNTVDPYSRLVHNIEVDSRLRTKDPSKATNGHDIENRRSYSFDVRPQYEAKLESGYHSTSDIQKMNGGVVKSGSQDKQLARAMLSHRIKVAEKKEKKGSMEINKSPVSTKGEVTTTVSTKSSPSESDNKRWSTNSPLQHRKLLPDHVTQFNKAGSAPPCLPPEDKGESALAPATISKAQGTKQLNIVGRQKATPSKKNPLPHTSEQVPLLSREDSAESSGDLYSPPSEDVTFIARGKATEQHSKRPVSGTSSTNRSSSGSNQNYDHLDEFLGKKQEPWETFSNSGSPSPAPPIITLTSGSDVELDLQASSRLSNGSSSNESGVYDHLPVLSPPPDGHAHSLEEPGMLQSMNRNISAPVLAQSSQSARASPSDQFGRFGSIDEESSEEELEVTPTNSDDESKKESSEPNKVEFIGVTLRQKRKIEDPFADLLSPKSSARLRWSQELNPLYDYRGFKADGVKLYDSSPVSKLLQSTMASCLEGGAGGGNHAKPPSVILEDEGEQERASSTVSEDTQSLGSVDIMQSPTSPCSSYGEIEVEIGTGEAITTMPRSRRPPMHAYEDVVQSHHLTRHQPHDYEDINTFVSPPSPASLPTSPSPLTVMEMVKRSESSGADNARNKQKQTLKSSTVMNPELPVLSRYREMNKTGVSPRLGKRQIVQQRRSRTLAIRDDSETAKLKQRPLRVADVLKDFSFVMREYRLFFVKLPNGYMVREIVCINKPISELREKLCDYLGVDNPEQYQISVEGVCLSTLRENDTGEVVRVNRAGLNYLVDSQILPDQGTDPILLKANLSFRMQGISTSRILALNPIDPSEVANTSYASEPPPEEDEFHKCWISVVQGNHPLTLENSVKLAALQYQAYFLDRTAVNSVVGFSRPTEFLPVEYTNVRGVEQKMYKEQEGLLKKTHQEIEESYIEHCSGLETYGAVFFPAREPRKKLLQSTKLKPVIFGVGPRGILRVDPKTKELLGFWPYNVLKNWAYSKRTFVLAFKDKNFPVESNQSKWISTLVDFFVDSLLISTTTAQTMEEAKTKKT